MSLVSTSAKSSGSSSGGATLIGIQTLAADAASMSVSSIPATYSALLLALLLRTTRASETDGVLIRFNGDTTVANYITGQYQNNAGTNTTSQISTQGGVNIQSTGASATAGFFAGWHALVTGYDTTSTYTSVNAQGVCRISTGVVQWTNAGVWSPTTVVTSITAVPVIGPNFLAGSRLAVYGLAES